MDIKQQLIGIFAETFEVEVAEVPNIEYQSVEAWDSIGHMMMISAVEEKFNISVEMDDVIVISNLEECVNVVSKYVN